MTEFDLGWIVGFLEGEGSFTGKFGMQPRSRVTATNTDQEPLERLSRLLGGKIYGHYRRRLLPHWKPSLQWFVGSQEARNLMALLRPHMSQKRQAQIDRALLLDTSVPRGSAAFVEQRRRAAQIRWARAHD